MGDTIQSSDPDFVLTVDLPLQKKEISPKEESALKSLVSKLNSKGFRTQVRPGSDPEHCLLFFIKLITSDSLEKSLDGRITSSEAESADRIGDIYEFLTSSEESGGVGITPLSGEWTFVKGIAPVTLIFKHSSWTQDAKEYILGSQESIDVIREKYGVQIGMYFDFLKFFTIWLVPLAILGITSFLKSKLTFLMTYTLVNLLWGLLFMIFWNRREKYLASIWGIKANDQTVEDLPVSKSDLETKTKSDGIRFIKELAFVPIALLFTIVLISYQLSCFVLEIFLTEIYDGPGKMFLSLIPTILISAFVPALTIVYNIVTDKVISWEHHEDFFSRENSILIKSFVLNFLTSYMPLVITSFVYLPFAHLVEPHLGEIKHTIYSSIDENRFYFKYLTQLKRHEDFRINQERLNMQFNYFIVTNQVIQIVLKYGLPIILRKGIELIKSKLKKPEVPTKNIDSTDEKKWLTSAREVLELPEYDVNDDFRGIVILYGYLILFGPVWSLAPVISICFNVITFRLDTFKLFSGKYFKPPVPKVTNTIYPWNIALFLLTWLGTIISPLITSFYRHGTNPPKTLGKLALDKASVHVSSTTKLVFLLFAIEHSYLVAYLVLSRLSECFKDKTSDNILDREDKKGTSVQAKLDLIWTKFSESQVIDQATSILAKGRSRALVSGPSESKLSLSKTDVSLKSSESSSTAVNARGGVVSNSQSGDLKDDKQALNAEQETFNAPSTIPGVNGEKKELIKEKTEMLKEKENELKLAEEKHVLALNKVKDEGDSIIKSKDKDGNEAYSTIDNNSHINPEVIDTEAPKGELPSPETAKHGNIAKSVSSEAFAGSSASGLPKHVQGLANGSLSKTTSDSQETSKDTSEREDSEINGKGSRSVSEDKKVSKNHSNNANKTGEVKLGKKKSSLKKLFKK
ncbi:uncharacterized protein PRCAT00001578001 [Priceomyces carsonii]|uniref:uncharacterized protein n=1 Tax=Priceomyces carsonii TaxID=28549 RepID=UPI002ED8C85D|nr:unnamed protein product [Priceomyces carsonii]